MRRPGEPEPITLADLHRSIEWLRDGIAEVKRLVLAFPKAQPRRITIQAKTAAQMLDLSAGALRKLINCDTFTVRRPQGLWGPGKRLFLYLDEVELYGETRSEDAVRNLRYQKKRLKNW